MQYSATANQAFMLLQQGQDLEADDLMVEATANALTNFGPKSIAYMTCLREHAMLLQSMGNLIESAEFLNQAREISPTGKDGEKLKATVCADLGQVLTAKGDFREAEKAFEECLQISAQCYGTNHPEYGVALLNLGEAKLHCGKCTEAIRFADGAREILDIARSELAYDALAIAGVARQSIGESPERLGIAASYLTPNDLTVLARRVIERLTAFPSHLQSPVLERLYHDLNGLPALSDENRLSLLEQLSYHLDRDEDYAKAEKYWRECKKLADELDDPELIINSIAETGKTIARAGNFDDAEKELIEALNLAQKWQQPVLVAFAMRGYSWILARHNRLKDAELYLRQALVIARQSGNDQAVFANLVDCGVFLHHIGRYEESTEALQEAIAVDTEYLHLVERAVLHLQTAGEELVCGCFGDVDVKQICDDIADEIDPEFIFNELISGITIDKKGSVSIQLSRSPNSQEESLLDDYCVKIMEALGQARRIANKQRWRTTGLL